METLNPQLVAIAHDVIAEMREENWEERDIVWSTCGMIIKRSFPPQGNAPTKEQMAAIYALVLQVMKEEEPALQNCPYCHQMHEARLIEQCPLKPR